MKIATLGEVMIELVQQSEGLFSMSLKGDVLDSAAVFSGFELNTLFISALSNDPYSTDILQCLKRQNIPIDYVSIYKEKEPSLYIVSDRKNTGRHLNYWGGSSPAKMFFNSMKNLNKLKNYTQKCDAIYWTGRTMSIMGSSFRRAWLTYLKQYRREGGKVFFAFNYTPLLWKRQRGTAEWYREATTECDMLFASQKDILSVFGQSDIRHTIHTLGAIKSIINSSEQIKVLTYSKRKTRQLFQVANNFNSANDAFIGGVISSCLRGVNIHSAINIGLRVGAMTLQAQTGILSPEEYLFVYQNEAKQVSSMASPQLR